MGGKSVEEEGGGGLAMENADTAWLFYMAAHELAENVTKYSTSSNVSLEVEMRECDGKHVMKITSRNETTPERLRETARRLDAIKNADDPVALYDQLAMESAPIQGVSGLGLARIRAESDFSMDYSINGCELCISVHAPVKIKEQQ